MRGSALLDDVQHYARGIPNRGRFPAATPVILFGVTPTVSEPEGSAPRDAEQSAAPAKGAGALPTGRVGASPQPSGHSTRAVDVARLGKQRRRYLMSCGNLDSPPGVPRQRQL